MTQTHLAYFCLSVSTKCFHYLTLVPSRIVIVPGNSSCSTEWVGGGGWGAVCARVCVCTWGGGGWQGEELQEVARKDEEGEASY